MSQDVRVEAAIGAVRGVMRHIASSDEYRAHFAKGAPQAASVRVRTSFLRRLVKESRAAVGHLGAALDGCDAPEALQVSLRAGVAELGAQLDWLDARARMPAAEAPEVPGRVLRDLLLAVQQARNALGSDPSLSMKAAAKLEAGEAAKLEGVQSKEPAEPGSEGSETGPVPQLGLGKGRSMKPLLQILPLDHLQKCLAEHLRDLPNGPTSPPWGMFFQQALNLGGALLLAGLESSLATLEVSLYNKRFLCMIRGFPV